MSASSSLSTALHPVIARLQARAQRHLVDTPHGTVCWRSFGEGPALLLLHGGHGSWMHWGRNIEALSERFTLWVADLPGYGDSEVPGSRTELPRLLAALEASLDILLGRGATLDLAGFSFGSLVGANLAVQRGGVRRFALLGAAGHGGARRPRGELQGWKEAAQDPDPSVLAAVMRHNLGVHMLHDLDRIDPLALQVHTLSCQRTRFRSKEISRAGGLQGLLERAEVTLMLVWGEHDVTAVPEAIAPQIAPNAPGRRVHVVPGAGHWVQYEGHEAVNPLLSGFFGG